MPGRWGETYLSQSADGWYRRPSAGRGMFGMGCAWKKLTTTSSYSAFSIWADGSNNLRLRSRTRYSKWRRLRVAADSDFLRDGFFPTVLKRVGRKLGGKFRHGILGDNHPPRRTIKCGERLVACGTIHARKPRVFRFSYSIDQ